MCGILLGDISVADIDAHDGQLAIFRRLIALGVILMELDECRGLGRGNTGHAGIGDEQRIGHALFTAIGIDGVDQRLGRLGPGADAVIDLVQEQPAAQIADKGILVDTGTVEGLGKTLAVELSGRIQKGRRGFQRMPQHIVRCAQT